ncbi:tryptophan-rich sensory protein [Siphonobacter curvatus]|uniref:Lantibiotic ABC transporter permease n=1 Tax=Siphonobacter curvatus TaxID=2094562 RepID=A0A2S7IL15_9BACT|nr:tryptophan-rich sensory protein [Siphonobacter curvatus]PQA58339.1 hypothetical protein C5O19_01290 [Siphonobacter curvatus]
MKTYVNADIRPESRPSFAIKTLQILNFVTFLITLVVNWAAVSLPLNGKSTRQLSDQYPNLFTPAGLTFSVWGVIYTMTAIFVFFQLKGLFSSLSSDYVNRVVRRLSGWFIASNLLNATWIIAWHYEYVTLSVVIMLAILVTQLTLLVRVHEVSEVDTSWGQRFVVRTPFGLYAGWISIATIANITAWLVSINWNQFGVSAEVWTVIMIITGTILAQLVLFTLRSVSYGLVVIWAIVGIILKRYQTPDPNMTIVYVCEICILILTISVILIAFTNLVIPIRKSPTLHWTRPRIQHD